MDREGRFPDFSRGEEEPEKQLWLLRTVTENTISLTYSVVWKYRYFHHLEPSFGSSFLPSLFFHLHFLKQCFIVILLSFSEIAKLLLIFSFN